MELNLVIEMVLLDDEEVMVKMEKTELHEVQVCMDDEVLECGILVVQREAVV